MTARPETRAPLVDVFELLCLLVLSSFAAIPFVDPQNGPLILQLVFVGLFGLTAGLVTSGVRHA